MAEKKLRPKYLVRRILEGEDSAAVFATVNFVAPPDMLSTSPDNVDSPFVLMPRKDPAAFVAMITYAQYCEPQLRVEIFDWLIRVAEAPPEFGTQGARNWGAGRVRSVTEI